MSKKIKARSFIDSAWINNFWFVGDYLYVTDSHFDNPKKNLLGRIKISDLEENLEIKDDFDRSFIAHPNPLVSDAKKASQSDIELVNYFRGFIYNVFKYENVVYVSIIKNDQESYVVMIDEHDKQTELPQYKNYLVVGELNNKLVLKSVKTRETYLAEPIQTMDGKELLSLEQTQLIETKLRRIKRICYLVDKYVILTDLNHLYTLKRDSEEYTTLKDDEDEINICSFDKSSFVISDKASRSTYVVNRNNEIEDVYQNYFYRLDSYNKVLLIGKPLYMDHDLVESYTLPLMFIR